MSHASCGGSGCLAQAPSMACCRGPVALLSCPYVQFEVVQYRLKDEYGVDTTLDPLPYTIARCAALPQCARAT